ncbi:hypothetical protein J3459_008180 [Metarhizium acridum]|nr:hypothetical protein J3459_008180 [Metarhizium acridum]
MPLREGSLTTFMRTIPIPNNEQLCMDVLGQMLSALDYLASEDLVHRDLKPDNILYSTLPDNGGFRFQLADFGFANHHSLAKSICGTGYYQAPELWPGKSKVSKSFRRHTSDYGIILSALEAKAPQSFLEPMGRLHPDRWGIGVRRCFAFYFDGKGLTAPRSKIAPIEPNTEKVPQASPSPAAGPSRTTQTRNDDGGKIPQQLKAAARPLVHYPPRRGPGPPSTDTSQQGL